MPNPTIREKVLRDWERSAAVLTAAEMLEALGGSETRGPLEDAFGKSLEESLGGHNPIWYLLLSCWFENDPSLLWPPAHRDILCRDLLEFYFRPMPEYAGHVILWPKDTFKSTIALAFMQFVLTRSRVVLGRDTTVCITHHKEEFAAKNLETLKARFKTHAWMLQRYPELCGRERKLGIATAFNLPGRPVDKSGAMEPSVFACGVGTVVAGWKFEWDLNDDIVTEDHIDSEAVRKETVRRYEVGRKMLAAGVGKELNIGHRFHIHDQWGRLLEATREDGTPLYTRSVRSAIDDADRLLVPNRHTAESLERERQEEIARTGTDYLWWAFKQNDPRRASDIVFDTSWYSYFSLEEVGWRRFVLRLQKGLFADTAHKDDSTRGRGDLSVIQIWGFDQKEGLLHKWLLDQECSDEWDIYDCGREISHLARRWNLLDGILFSEEYGQKNSLFVMEREMRSRWGWTGKSVRLKTGGTFQRKRDRIQAFLTEFRSGRVHLNEKMKGLDKFRLSLESWNPRVQHGDDTVDCGALTCDEKVVEQFGLMDEGGQDEGLFGLETAEDLRLSRYSPL